MGVGVPVHTPRALQHKPRNQKNKPEKEQRAPHVSGSETAIPPEVSTHETVLYQPHYLSFTLQRCFYCYYCNVLDNNS